VQKEHETNAIYCKMMGHERSVKYFATFNATECFSKLLKIAQFYFSIIAHYICGTYFFLDAATMP